MKFARALRPIFVQAKRGIGEMSEVKPQMKIITTREEFARHWPKLYAKQEHHIRQLKKGIPVHISGGPGEVMLNNTLYVSAIVSIAYCMYMYASLSLK